MGNDSELETVQEVFLSAWADALLDEAHGGWPTIDCEQSKGQPTLNAGFKQTP